MRASMAALGCCSSLRCWHFMLPVCAGALVRLAFGVQVALPRWCTNNAFGAPEQAMQYLRCGFALVPLVLRAAALLRLARLRRPARAAELVRLARNVGPGRRCGAGVPRWWLRCRASVSRCCADASRCCVCASRCAGAPGAHTFGVCIICSCAGAPGALGSPWQALRCWCLALEWVLYCPCASRCCAGVSRFSADVSRCGAGAPDVFLAPRSCCYLGTIGAFGASR